MKYISPFAIIAGMGVCFVSPLWAQQPPDVVNSDPYLNTAMGSSALENLNISGCPSGICPGSNTAGGAHALMSNSTGSQNTAFGTGALYSNDTGGNNTATGYEALYFNRGGSVNGGSSNTATGASALYSNTTGNQNTATGVGALYANTTGIGNTATGVASLDSNTTGSENTATGYGALGQNSSGNQNSASGRNALTTNTIGNNNTASGYQSLYFNWMGGNNTATGYNALYANSTGSNNIALGFNAGSTITGSNNIDIGNAGIPNENGVIRIGAPSTQKAAFVAGIGNSHVTGSAVYVNSAGRLGVLASSERYKTAVTPMGKNTEKLQQLRPVSFHLKIDPDGALQYGLIAEEVDKVYPELVIRDEAGNIQGVRYDELAPMLLNEMQKQRQELKELQQLKKQVSALARLNQTMQAALLTMQTKKERVTLR